MPSFHAITIGNGVVLNTPSADGSAGQFLQTDGSGGLDWGSADPGGSDTQVQYNNNGSFDGVPSFTYNGSVVDLPLGTYVNGGHVGSGMVLGYGTGHVLALGSQASAKVTAIHGNSNVIYTSGGEVAAYRSYGSSQGGYSHVYGNYNLISNVSTTDPTLIVQTPASHADNSFEVQDSTSATLAYIDQNGQGMVSDRLTFNQTANGEQHYIGVSQIGFQFYSDYNNTTVMNVNANEIRLNKDLEFGAFNTSTTTYNIGPDAQSSYSRANNSGDGHSLYFRAQNAGPTSASGGAGGSLNFDSGDAAIGDFDGGDITFGIGAGSGSGVAGNFVVQDKAATTDFLTINSEDGTVKTKSGLGFGDSNVAANGYAFEEPSGDYHFKATTGVTARGFGWFGSTVRFGNRLNATTFTGSEWAGSQYFLNGTTYTLVNQGSGIQINNQGISFSTNTDARNIYGNGNLRSSIVPGSNDELIITNTSTSTPTLVVQTPASHADNAFEIQDSTAATLAAIDQNGKLISSTASGGLSLRQGSYDWSMTTSGNTLTLEEVGGVGYASLTLNSFNNSTHYFSLINKTVGIHSGYSNGGSAGFLFINRGTDGGSLASLQQDDDNRFAFDVLNRAAYIGGSTNASPTAGTVSGTRGSGTDIAGADLIVAGGAGTGTGAGGHVVIQGAPLSSTGSTLNTLTDLVEISPDHATANYGSQIGLWGADVDDTTNLFAGVGSDDANWIIGEGGGVNSKVGLAFFRDSNRVMGTRLYHNGNQWTTVLENTYASGGYLQMRSGGSIGVVTHTTGETTVGSTTLRDGSFNVQGLSTAEPSLLIQMPASHADNALEIQDSTTTVVASFDSTGALDIPTSSNGLTVGPYVFNGRTITGNSGVNTLYSFQFGHGSQYMHLGAPSTSGAVLELHGESHTGNKACFTLIANDTDTSGGAPTDSEIQAGNPGPSNTDVAGANLYIKAGAGTGTGAGGSIILQTAATGSSGTSVNALSTVLEIADDDTIGFFGATPVAQQSGTGETTGFTAGAGTGVNDDSTFTGNVGATAYRINDVVKALKNLGLLAQ